MSREFTEGQVRMLVIYEEKLSIIRNRKTKTKPQLKTTLHVPDWQKLESQQLPSVGGEIRILMLFLLECQLIGCFRDNSGCVSWNNTWIYSILSGSVQIYPETLEQGHMRTCKRMFIASLCSQRVGRSLLIVTWTEKVSR